MDGRHIGWMNLYNNLFIHFQTNELKEYYEKEISSLKSYQYQCPWPGNCPCCEHWTNGERGMLRSSRGAYSGRSRGRGDNRRRFNDGVGYNGQGSYFAREGYNSRGPYYDRGGYRGSYRGSYQY